MKFQNITFKAKKKPEDVRNLYTNTTPCYIRNFHLHILISINEKFKFKK